MKLGYYQIFWDKQGTNTFEYRYDVEVSVLKQQGIIQAFTLVDFLKENLENKSSNTPDFDLDELLKYWRKFYSDNHIDWITLPDKVTLTPDQIREITKLMEKGFDKMIIIPANLVGQLTQPATHFQNLHRITTQGYYKTFQSNNYKADGGLGAGTEKTTQLRIIITKDIQELRDDELFKQTLGKSIDDLTTAPTGLLSNYTGLSEAEYLIYQREYFQRTGKHLDAKDFTWLPNSIRPSSGRVPCSDWYTGVGRMGFYSCSSDYRDDHLGCRLAVSFKIYNLENIIKELKEKG